MRLALLHEVGLPDPDTTIRAYPFQLSGGQRQRVVIAMALALEPKILIADEPTTALDVTTQAQILDLIEDLRRNHGMAVLFITHDFGVVADIADRIIVMQSGEVVESGEADTVLLNPATAYTRALLDAIPRLSLHDGVETGAAADPILRVRDLSMTFRTRSSGHLRETARGQGGAARDVRSVQGRDRRHRRRERIGQIDARSLPRAPADPR